MILVFCPHVDSVFPSPRRRGKVRLCLDSSQVFSGCGPHGFIADCVAVAECRFSPFYIAKHRIGIVKYCTSIGCRGRPAARLTRQHRKSSSVRLVIADRNDTANQIAISENGIRGKSDSPNSKSLFRPQATSVTHSPFCFWTRNVRQVLEVLSYLDPVAPTGPGCGFHFRTVLRDRSVKTDTAPLT